MGTLLAFRRGRSVPSFLRVFIVIVEVQSGYQFFHMLWCNQVSQSGKYPIVIPYLLATQCFVHVPESLDPQVFVKQYTRTWCIDESCPIPWSIPTVRYVSEMLRTSAIKADTVHIESGIAKLKSMVAICVERLTSAIFTTPNEDTHQIAVLKTQRKDRIDDGLDTLGLLAQKTPVLCSPKIFFV